MQILSGLNSGFFGIGLLCFIFVASSLCSPMMFGGVMMARLGGGAADLVLRFPCRSIVW